MSGHTVNATHSSDAAQMFAHSKLVFTGPPKPAMFCISFLPLQKFFPSNLVKVILAILVAVRVLCVDTVVVAVVVVVVVAAAVVVVVAVLLAVDVAVVVVVLVVVVAELTLVVALAVIVLGCPST